MEGWVVKKYYSDTFGGLGHIQKNSWLFWQQSGEDTNRARLHYSYEPWRCQTKIILSVMSTCHKIAFLSIWIVNQSHLLYSEQSGNNCQLTCTTKLSHITYSDIVNRKSIVFLVQNYRVIYNKNPVAHNTYMCVCTWEF